MSLSASADLSGPTLSSEEDEARFVARLTLDVCIAQLRANNGVGQPNVPAAVIQALGLLQGARRQVAAVRSGETIVVTSPAAAEAGA